MSLGRDSWHLSTNNFSPKKGISTNLAELAQQYWPVSQGEISLAAVANLTCLYFFCLWSPSIVYKSDFFCLFKVVHEYIRLK